MGREKRHHYVPMSYLARFTTSGTAEGELWVFDIDRATSWPSSPAKTALERDYNRVELEGVDPLLVKKQVFGEIEGAAKTAFDEVIGAGHEALVKSAPGIKTSEVTFRTVLLFLSAQSIRVPHIREGLQAFQTDAVRTIARMLAKSRKAFEAAREKDPEMGDVTFEEFQAFVAEHGTVLEIEASTTHDLGVTLPSLFPLVPVLRHRPWTLLYAPDDGPSFVTSDMPVVVVPREEDPFWGVGFGAPDSTVLFPLSRRVLLRAARRPATRDSTRYSP